MPNVSQIGSWGLLNQNNVAVDLLNVLAPIGTIICFNPGYFTDASNAGFTVTGPTANTVAAVNTYLPSNWRVADGTIPNNSSSPIWNDGTRRLPNLTSERFIKGSTSAGSIGGAASSSISHTHSVTSNVVIGDHTLVAGNLPLHSHSIDHDHAVTTSTGMSANDPHAHNNGSTNTIAAVGSTSNQFAAGGAGSNYAASGTVWDIKTQSVAHTHNVDLPNYVGTSGNGPGTASAIVHTTTNNAVTSGTSSISSVAIEPTFLTTYYIVRVA